MRCPPPPPKKCVPATTAQLNSQSLSLRRTIEIAAAVKNTFEPVLLLHLYPRSSIDIYLQILENDGCQFPRPSFA